MKFTEGYNEGFKCGYWIGFIVGMIICSVAWIAMFSIGGVM